jgi:hypothetical protein
MIGHRETVLLLAGLACAFVRTAAETPGPTLTLTATTGNLTGPHDSIRIDLFRWSTDAERDQLLDAWNLKPAPRGRGGRPLTVDPAPDPAAVDADARPAARGGRGGRGGANAAETPRLTPEAFLTAALGKATPVGRLWSSEVAQGADLAAHDQDKKNDGPFGSSIEPLMPVDYAVVPNNAVIMHEDAAKIMMQRMKEKGIKHITSECTMRGFTCSVANVDPKTATPAEIVKIRKIQTGYQVDGITGGLGGKDNVATKLRSSLERALRVSATRSTVTRKRDIESASRGENQD